MRFGLRFELMACYGRSGIHRWQGRFALLPGWNTTGSRKRGNSPTLSKMTAHSPKPLGHHDAT